MNPDLQSMMTLTLTGSNPLRAFHYQTISVRTYLLSFQTQPACIFLHIGDSNVDDSCLDVVTNVLTRVVP